MKVMLQVDQTQEYIDKADEIYVPYSRVDLVETIYELYPNKNIVLDLTTTLPEEVDLDELKMLSGLCRGHLKILVLIDYYAEIPTLYRILAYPMHSIYEMYCAYKNGIREFYIGAELLHQLPKVAEFKAYYGDITIRLVANKSAFGVEGIAGSAVGAHLFPQEIDLVDDIIDVIEFQADNSTQESAYYRIYFEDKYYGGNIKDLILDFDTEGLVRIIDPTQRRFECNMSCLFGECHLCHFNVQLANINLYTDKGE